MLLMNKVIFCRLSAIVYEQNTQEEEKSTTVDSPVKNLKFSKEFIKDKLIHQVVGWLNQKCLDAQVGVCFIGLIEYNNQYPVRVAGIYLFARY